MLDRYIDAALHTMQHIAVKFEEINLKVQEVRKSSRCNKVRKSSRSTFSHSCQQKSLTTVTMFFSARMLNY